MESKHKNALIGALLAVVFVMAVGYAAFAQQLTINGTATITSNWDVHFDTDYDDDITPVAGKIGVAPAQGEDTRPQSTTEPTGTISTLQNLSATLAADLKQPGDTVTFVLHVKNYGTSLKAKAVSTSPSVSVNNGGTCSNLVCTTDHIKWTVSATNQTLNPDSTGEGNYDTVTIIAEYTDVQQNENFSGQATSSTLTVVLDYEQVNS